MRILEKQEIKVRTQTPTAKPKVSQAIYHWMEVLANPKKDSP